MSKPSQVVTAVRIMWAMLIIGGLYILLVATMAMLATGGRASFDLVPSISVVMLIGLLALLVRAVSAGRNWARVLYGAFAVVAILAVGASLLRAPEFALLAGSLHIILIALYGFVLYLLFHPASNRWFSIPNASAP